MSRCLRCLLSVLIAAVGMINTASGQVATDGTIGPRIQLGGPDYAIGAELGRRTGGNLFHSFERFSIGTGESATFSGPDDVRNVISRVTGGARSEIDGTLASTIPGANFYFLNPAGVLFGPNARLDVQGSFHVSTADELRFADGAKFSSTDPATSSLTIAAPEAFGFLGANAGAIVVDRSTLVVPAGEALSLVGGDVIVDGGNKRAPRGSKPGLLRAEAGRVTLAALDTAGAVSVRAGQVTGSNFADVRFTDNALLDVSGDASGTALIRGGRVIIDGSSIRASTSVMDGAPEAVTIEAIDLVITNRAHIATRATGDGNAGKVRLASGNLEITNALISTISDGAGIAGPVMITADELIIRDGAFIDSITFGPSKGAVVTLKAANLMISNGFIVSFTWGRGDSGGVSVTADKLIIYDSIIDSSTFGSGDAGQISLFSRRIFVSDSEIRSSGTFLLLGHFIDIPDVFADDGDIIIPGFNLIDHARHVTDQEFQSSMGISIQALESIIGDDIRAFADDERLFFSRDTIFLVIGSDRDIGYTLTGGVGVGGDVVITGSTLVVESGSISTEGATTVGGRIVVEMTGLIDLVGASVTANGFVPSGGDSLITLQAPLIVLDGSAVTSLTGGGLPLAGSGEARLLGGVTIISADSEVAASSTLEVTGLESELGSQLIVLDVPLIDAAALLRERCEARRDVGASSFTGIGRGGLPPSPDQPLLSDYRIGAAAAGEAVRSHVPEAEIGPFEGLAEQGSLALAPVVLVRSCTGAL